MQVTEQDVAELMPRLQEARRAAERTDVPFEVKVTPLVGPDPDAMARLGDLGVTDVVTVPWYFYGGDPNDLTIKLDSVRRFADDVIRPLAERS